jgi:hypothetical protein
VITVFTIPKPFEGHIGLIQRNALASWRALHDDLEIIVFGDEKGAAEEAARVGAAHVAELERTEFGTPLVSGAFEAARAAARHGLLCYANADMILLPDLFDAAARVRGRRCLVVGRRRGLDVTEELDFGGDGPRRLRKAAREHGVLGTPSQIDYFLFPRDVPWQMPPFAVGRPNWDNWVIYRARALGLRVIDATAVATAVHQNHAYGHIPLGRGKGWEGPEADHNLELVEGGLLRFNLLDATHVLTPRGLIPAVGWRHLKRRLIRLGVGNRRIGDALGQLIAIRRRFGRWSR